MAENGPYRPFADIHVMQRTFVVHARVCRIRVLQNFIAENNFFARGDNLGQPSPLCEIKIQAIRRRLLTEVEFNIELRRKSSRGLSS
jgi:hypothetical protein